MQVCSAASTTPTLRACSMVSRQSATCLVSRFARRAEWDVACQHKLVVPGVIRRGRELKRSRVEELGVGAGRPGRRLTPRLGVELDTER
jgi:hypothetical protein